MTTMSAAEASTNIYKLIDQLADSHQPITITGKRSNAVIISEEDWLSMQATLHLLSIPGMGESIAEGLKTPIDECVMELE